jgi:putative peptidoglycan lipid II flippase
VQTAAASFMLIGSISALNFANNIQGLPVGLVGIALSSAIFPTLTEIALLGNKEEMRHKIIKSLKITLFIIVPLTVFLIVLRAQAVRLILGAGMFTWHDTYVTSQVVGILAISLVAQCFVYLLNQAFFAYHDTRTPLKAAAAAFVLNIVFIVLLAGRSHFSLHWGVDGIALAFTLASITEATVLIVSLRKMIGGFFKDTVRYGFLMLIFSLVAGIFVQITKTYLGSILNLQHTIFVLIQGLVPFVIGAAIFLVLVYFFHVPELAEFNKIKEKLF